MDDAHAAGIKRCDMCGLSPESAPTPWTFWPQLDKWICAHWDCRRHAERECFPERFKPLDAKLEKVKR